MADIASVGLEEEFSSFPAWSAVGIGTVGIKAMDVLQSTWPGFAYYALDTEIEARSELLHRSAAARRVGVSSADVLWQGELVLCGIKPPELPEGCADLAALFTGKEYALIAAALDSREEILLAALLGHIARLSGVKLVNAVFLQPLRDDFSGGLDWKRIYSALNSIFDCYVCKPFSTYGTELAMGLKGVSSKPSAKMLACSLKPFMAFGKYPHFHRGSLGALHKICKGKMRAYTGLGVASGKWRCSEAVSAALQEAISLGVGASKISDILICISAPFPEIEAKELHFCRAAVKKFLDYEGKPLVFDFYDEGARRFALEVCAILLT